MLKPQTSWTASLPLLLIRRCSRTAASPSPAGDRPLSFVPVCKRRMSTLAHPRFAPLPTEQTESQTDGGAARYQFRLVSYNILAQVCLFFFS
ncbi:hypothetical protein Zm00014a_034166 [Zea mays]|uniref:Uncharacterized protein n=1 Tax=Zea mays TaxID=4577 RepID=A0A3L6EEX1_MAIZE|nr:hypothetical protein Zm00014a_034166 [Zea mays]